MKNYSIGLIVLFLMILMSLGLAQDSSPVTGNGTANGTANEAVNGAVNATAESALPAEAAPASEPASLHGIWKVSLGETDITMALNQSGDSLFGQAKFEGENPWNGVIAGSISGRAAHIALAAMQGKVLTSVEMMATDSAEGDSLQGSYVRSDSEGNAAKGELTATRISTDTAGYMPAVVETAKGTEINQAQTSTGQTAKSEVQARNSPFKDVKDLAKGIDPNILPRYAPL